MEGGNGRADGGIVPVVHSIPNPSSFLRSRRHRVQMQTRNESNGK